MAGRVGQSERIGSWDELMRVVSAYSSGEWIFRGVRKASYELVPTVGRTEVRKTLNEQGEASPVGYSPKGERRAFEEFRRRARPYLEFEPKDNWEWLAVAQHHRLPTRLLDWTKSPLIAAYFAVELAGSGQSDAAVYAVQTAELLEPSPEWDDPIALGGIALYYEPSHITRRIAVQQAVFTVHPVPTVGLEKEVRICKWTIDRKSCYSIKERLDICGINHASLFPDLEGLAAHIQWLLKWDKLRFRED